MYIPHFIHSPFYVYAYAFGDCLVNSLYAVYENAREGFAERYLAMLAAGGTKHYSELLKPFGLDAKDPKFWDGGLSVIAGMIDELEYVCSACKMSEPIWLDLSRSHRHACRAADDVRWTGRPPGSWPARVGALAASQPMALRTD
jgi:hypothetical protein